MKQLNYKPIGSVLLRLCGVVKCKIINISKYAKSRFTMTPTQTLFYDKVNGKAVISYKDCYGKYWMAHSKFGHRVAE